MPAIPTARRAAGFLALAAAPTFAAMALLTATLGGGAADLLCSQAHGASPLAGMSAMYGLMSLFHAAPWLNRRSTRNSA